MKIMVIAAHPKLNESRANKRFTGKVETQTDIYVHALYQEHPDWQINVEKEQQRLLQYDRIVLQFPFYWYSSPPLLKKWFDDVLTFGWAFGPEGNRLEGKEFIIAVTAGGKEGQYRSGGYNWFTINELLRPIQSTITRCKGIYLPAFVTYDAVAGTDEYLDQEAERYVNYIQRTAHELAN